MRTIIATLIAGASFVAIAGIAQADDHLWQALNNGHGLSTGPAADNNQAVGGTGDKAPGQGSPFTGDDTGTPSRDLELVPPSDRAQGKGPNK